jgi:hypothetical protein
MMLSSTLTSAIVMFVSTLVLLLVAFYRRIPGGGPKLGRWRGVCGVALGIRVALLVVSFGVIRMRSV